MTTIVIIITVIILDSWRYFIFATTKPYLPDPVQTRLVF